jgi:hypothetical protein
MQNYQYQPLLIVETRPGDDDLVQFPAKKDKFFQPFPYIRHHIAQSGILSCIIHLYQTDPTLVLGINIVQKKVLSLIFLISFK